MSAERTRTTRTTWGFTRLSCDFRHPNGDPCGQVIDGTDAVTARRSGREQGWRRHGGKDYCPAHAEEGDDA